MNVVAPQVRHPSSWRSRGRLWYRAWRYRLRHDPAEIAAVLRNARPNTLALDIGAHKGGYTYWMARGVGKAGRVYAFEPQAQLARTLAAAFDARRVVVVNAGVSDHDGTMTLHVPGDRPSPDASLVAPREATAGVRSSAIRVVKLDSFFADRAQPVSFIKCDVEGHELEVFRGAERLLRQDRPVVLFECEQRHNGTRPMREVFDFLHGLGYTGQYFTAGRLAPLATFDPQRDQCRPGDDAYCNNFLFVAESERSAV